MLLMAFFAIDIFCQYHPKQSYFTCVKHDVQDVPITFLFLNFHFNYDIVYIQYGIKEIITPQSYWQ